MDLFWMRLSLVGSVLLLVGGLAVPAASAVEVAVQAPVTDLADPATLDLKAPVEASTLPAPPIKIAIPVLGGSVALQPGTAPTDSSSAPGTAPHITLPGGPMAAGLGLVGLIAAALYLISHLLGFSLFSRIEGASVLEHASRARIMQALETRPGLSLLELRQHLGIAWGTMWHHVRRLERNGQIVSVREGPRRLLYAANSPAGNARRDLALLHNGTAQRIAQAIQATPDLAATAICQRLALRQPSVSKHLARLAAGGLVEKHVAGARHSYVATPRLAGALAMTA